MAVLGNSSAILDNVNQMMNGFLPFTSSLTSLMGSISSGMTVFLNELVASFVKKVDDGEMLIAKQAVIKPTSIILDDTMGVDAQAIDTKLKANGGLVPSGSGLSSGGVIAIAVIASIVGIAIIVGIIVSVMKKGK